MILSYECFLEWKSVSVFNSNFNVKKKVFSSCANTGVWLVTFIYSYSNEWELHNTLAFLRLQVKLYFLNLPFYSDRKEVFSLFCTFSILFIPFSQHVLSHMLRQTANSYTSTQLLQSRQDDRGAKKGQDKLICSSLCFRLKLKKY